MFFAARVEQPTECEARSAPTGRRPQAEANWQPPLAGHSSHWLERRFLERTEHRIHAGLVTRPLRLEPLEHVCVDAQRN